MKFGSNAERNFATTARTRRRLAGAAALLTSVVFLLEGAAAQDPAKVPISRLETPIFVLMPRNAPLYAGKEASIRCLLLSREGLPVRDASSVTVAVEPGRIVDFETPLPGLLEIRYLPPPTDESTTARLKLNAVVDGSTISEIVELAVQARHPGELSLKLKEDSLLIGRSDRMRFLVQGYDATGRPIQAPDVEVETNVGSIEGLKTVQPGRVEGTLVLGALSSPQVAIVAAFVGEGAEEVGAWQALRLIGAPRIPVSTERGSTVWVEVAGRKFGPFAVGDEGRLKIPVQIPPGVASVLVHARDRAGNTTRSTVDLSIPAFPNALLHLDRARYRIDEQEPVRLTLIQIDENGDPAALPIVNWSVSGGRVSGLVETSPGTFKSSYYPPTRPGRHEVRVRIPLEGGTEQIYSVGVEVQEGTPDRVELTVTPAVLRTDDPPAEVSLRVLDKAGNPTSGASPEATVEFGSIERFRTLAPGEYVAAFRPRASLDSVERDSGGYVNVPVRIWVRRAAAAGPVESIAIAADRWVLEPNGESVNVEALAMDRWGNPVRGVSMSPSVTGGGGEVSGAQVTDERGRAGFAYRPGDRIGPVRVRIESEEGGISGELLLIQAFGAPSDELVARVSNPSLDELTVLRAETTVKIAAGLVHTIQISVLPNVLYTGSGQYSRIRVRLEDKTGNFVVDPDIQIEADLGTVSEVTRTPDGLYVARYTPPAISRAADSDVITVSNDANEYSSSTELQIFRKEGRWMGAARVGYHTNFGAVSSPTVDLQGIARLPAGSVVLALGGSLGYFSFSSVGPDPIRYSFVPIHLFAGLRGQNGRLSTYVGAGPMANIAIVRAELPVLVEATAQESAVGSEPGTSGAEGATGMWETATRVAVFPGFGGILGIELGVGPGGIQLEIMGSWIQGYAVFDEQVEVSDNLGGLTLRTGYVAHF